MLNRVIRESPASKVRTFELDEQTVKDLAGLLMASIAFEGRDAWAQSLFNVLTEDASLDYTSFEYDSDDGYFVVSE